MSKNLSAVMQMSQTRNIWNVHEVPLNGDTPVWTRPFAGFTRAPRNGCVPCPVEIFGPAMTKGPFVTLRMLLRPNQKHEGNMQMKVRLVPESPTESPELRMDCTVPACVEEK